LIAILSIQAPYDATILGGIAQVEAAQSAFDCRSDDGDNEYQHDSGAVFSRSLSDLQWRIGPLDNGPSCRAQLIIRTPGSTTSGVRDTSAHIGASITDVSPVLCGFGNLWAE
jgi:hypothetical protein